MATIDGQIDELPLNARLDTPQTGTAGYALYGYRDGTDFIFAMTSEEARIGAGTTLWFDTDVDRSTGYQIWGFTGGTEYNVGVSRDGVARLFTGAAGQTRVSSLEYACSADGRALEMRVPAALLGGTDRLRVYADANDRAFLPNDYDNVDMFVGAAPSPPDPVDAPGLKIGIVYSETTAANFYSTTAYGQLFMSAQNQAMQAGIPYDMLTEADLKDPANLAGYDLVVFPGLSHVKAADLAAISGALQAAQQDYGTGFVVAGNFLTNDETGAAFAGDSCARMKSLLGVTLEGFGETNGLTVRANAGSNSILDGYGTGETIGSYTNNSFLHFTDVTGTGEVLFDQVVTAAGGGTTSHDAVIATQTGPGATCISPPTRSWATTTS